ncbi:hypothetical protein J4439_08020 [Candidatus Woesearchaeota archaeon]|nr:hypothetical protein [Candidatus Woesearchaeota archaeon]
MGLEDIKKEILEEARREAKRVLDEARRSSQEAVKQAQREAKEREERAKAELKDQLATLETRETASARFQARRRINTRKKELLDEFFSHCLREASKLDGATRKRHVKALLAHAKDFSVVYGRKEDLSNATKLAVRSATFAGGIMLETKDGTQRLDLSYETMLAAIAQKELPDISARLFGE